MNDRREGFAWESRYGTRVLMGYDGSLAAGAAIGVGAALVPEAHACLVHLWTVPFPGSGMRQHLRGHTATVAELAAAIDREGAHEAHRIAHDGVALAKAAGWHTDTVVRRTLGGEGLGLAEICEDLRPDLLVVGSRGLSGTRALLGSVSDVVVHHSPKPVLVVPYPLLAAEHRAAATGAVMVAWDGSPGARAAVSAASELFPARDLVIAAVGTPDEAPDLDNVDVPGRSVTRVRQRRRAHGLARAVAGELEACARRHGAAAMVVGSRGRSALSEILLGSVAMAVLHSAHRPVLVVPDSDRDPEAVETTDLS